MTGGNGARAVAFIAVVVTAIATWAVALDAGFFVDDYSIVRAASEGASRVLGDFTGNWVGFRGLPYYRPLVTLSFAVDHAFFGDAARGYHLSNVLLHAIASCLLLVTIRRLTAAPWLLAGAAACAFAAHPVHANGVAWIAARADVLGAVWILACVLAAAARSRWLAGFVTLALLTKETGVTALPLAATAALMARGGTIRNTVGFLAPTFLVAVLWLAVRTLVVDSTIVVYGPAWPASFATFRLHVEDAVTTALRAVVVAPRDADWVVLPALGAILWAAIVARTRPRARGGLLVGSLMVAGAVLTITPLAAVLRQVEPLDCGRFWYLAAAGTAIAVASVSSAPRILAVGTTVALVAATATVVPRSLTEVREQITDPIAITDAVVRRIASTPAVETDPAAPLFVILRGASDRYGPTHVNALSFAAASPHLVLPLGRDELGLVATHATGDRALVVIAPQPVGAAPAILHSAPRQRDAPAPERLTVSLASLTDRLPVADGPSGQRVRLVTPLGVYPPPQADALPAGSPLDDTLRMHLMITESLCRGHALLLVTDPDAPNHSRHLIHLRITR